MPAVVTDRTVLQRSAIACLNAPVSAPPVAAIRSPAISPELLHRAVQLVADADALIVSAGAGMGVDSGLPDFRGREGFWRAYPALAQARIDFAEIASPDAFRRDPRLAWGFYGHRLRLYRGARPHRGFDVLKRWVQRAAQGGFVFTSNVDGQFQAAGFDARHLYECHGSIHWLQCLRPCSSAVWSADELQPEIDGQRCAWLGELPSCPHCGGLARPNILMFDDWGWHGERYDHQAQQLGIWLSGVSRPVVIELGAGAQVPSVRHFSESLCERAGARLIRINPRDALVPKGQIGLPLGGAEALLAIEAGTQSFTA